MLRGQAIGWRRLQSSGIATVLGLSRFIPALWQIQKDSCGIRHEFLKMHDYLKLLASPSCIDLYSCHAHTLHSNDFSNVIMSPHKSKVLLLAGKLVLGLFQKWFGRFFFVSPFAPKALRNDPGEFALEALYRLIRLEPEAGQRRFSWKFPG